MNIVYFPTAEKFRLWLETNHATATELQIGFYKKASGKAGMSREEAVDEALCFGWIDGVVHKIDADRFTHRFTPRKPKSIWSNVNVAHVARLSKAGKMHVAGFRAFEARQANKTGIYSFEQKKTSSLSPAFLRKFKANRKAWAFFTSQALWYQRKIIHRIVSAKQPATQLRRLDRAIAASVTGTRI